MRSERRFSFIISFMVCHSALSIKPKMRWLVGFKKKKKRLVNRQKVNRSSVFFSG